MKDLENLEHPTKSAENNEETTIFECVETCLASTPSDFEIDNCQENDTVAILHSKDNVTVVEQSHMPEDYQDECGRLETDNEIDQGSSANNIEHNVISETSLEMQFSNELVTANPSISGLSLTTIREIPQFS